MMFLPLLHSTLCRCLSLLILVGSLASLSELHAVPRLEGWQQQAPLLGLRQLTELPFAPPLERSGIYFRALRLRALTEQMEEGEEEDLERVEFQGILTEETTVSYGLANSGLLFNGVQLKASEQLIVRPRRNYSTPEMIRAIQEAVERVEEEHPGSPKLIIGDLSRKGGGFFPPHVSHQSGRDADIGYYLKGGRQAKGLQKVSPHLLDTPRTWAFIYDLLQKGRVKYIFLDYRLQRPLYLYARDIAQIPARELLRYFAYPRGRGARVAIIRHLRGHDDHMHIRFHAPQSIAAAPLYEERFPQEVRKYKRLSRKIPRYHKIRRGDTLSRIARRYRVRWKKLLRWNKLNRRRARRLRPGKRLIVGWRRPSL